MAKFQDFIDLNKACPEDNLLLSRMINWWMQLWDMSY